MADGRRRRTSTGPQPRCTVVGGVLCRRQVWRLLALAILVGLPLHVREREKMRETEAGDSSIADGKQEHTCFCGATPQLQASHSLFLAA
jgi:hypothetical protein